MSDLQLGDVGTHIDVEVSDGGTAVNLSTATIKRLKFRKPDATIVTKDAAFVTDGTDGKLRYTTEQDFLAPAGKWKVQAYVELPSGKWHSATMEFKVVANLS